MLSIIQSKLVCPKNQKNNFGNYNYRSCEDILEALKPLLKDNNIYVTINDEIVLIGNRYYVKATANAITNDTGKLIASCTGWAREAESKKGMDEAQITGAASSYARKYALNGLFAIDDSKDPDTMKPEDNKKQPENPTHKPEQKPSESFFGVIEKSFSRGTLNKNKKPMKSNCVVISDKLYTVFDDKDFAFCKVGNYITGELKVENNFNQLKNISLVQDNNEPEPETDDNSLPF